MLFQLPPLLSRVQAALPAGQPAYLVGGALRDLLLGRPPHDFDFVLAAGAIRTGRQVAGALKADFFVLDESRDAGRVLLQTDGGRVVLDFIAQQGESLAADLAGRDLTINAMALDIHHPDQLIDPLNGAADLAAKRLRACAPGSLSSDPVRVLRALRLAAQLGMQIDAETRAQMRSAAPGLAGVSAERLRDELFRLLETPKLATSLRALDRLGALAPVLPELPAMQGVEQSPPHVFDVWEHSLRTLDRLEQIFGLLDEHYPAEGAGDLYGGLVVLHLGRFRTQISQLLGSQLSPGRGRRSLLALAALYHDSGKPATRSQQADGRIRFLGHEAFSAEAIAARAAALHLSNSERSYLHSVVAEHMRPYALTLTGQAPTRRAIYRFFRETGEAGVDICLLSAADFMGKYNVQLPQAELSAHLETLRALLAAYYEQQAEVVAPAPLLNGAELMAELALAPGPEIGRLLEALREAQAAGELADRAAALALARRLLG
ncbi:MAG: HD domain-containing protein [Anaerolineales bacterium]|nr:HD domain-containing protein [Anaerolineales bacterium]